MSVIFIFVVSLMVINIIYKFLKKKKQLFST